MKKLLSFVCLLLAVCASAWAQNPLVRTILQETEAKAFQRQSIFYRTTNVFEYTGDDLEIYAQILQDERNESHRVGTIMFAQKNYRSSQIKGGNSMKLGYSAPIGYVDINQVDSLIYVFNMIYKGFYREPAFGISYTVPGGLSLSFSSWKGEVEIQCKRFSPAYERNHDGFRRSYEEAEDVIVSAGPSAVIKDYNQLFDIIGALKQAKRKLEIKLEATE